MKNILLLILLVGYCTHGHAVTRDAASPVQTGTGQGTQPEAVYQSQLAVRKYPELGVEGSEFNRLFVKHYRALTDTNPNFFRVPDWPLRLADICARELDLQTASAASPAKSTSTVAARPVEQSKLPPSTSPPQGFSLDLINAFLGRFVAIGAAAIVVLVFLYYYILNWFRDFPLSFASLCVSPFAGLAAYACAAVLSQGGVVEKIHGVPILNAAAGVAMFLVLHLFWHFSRRCPQCNAHRWRAELISDTFVGERIVMRSRELVRKHFDRYGKLVGTTKENVSAPAVVRTYESTWKCRRCMATWKTWHET